MNERDTNGKQDKLYIQPVSFAEACQFVEDYHRHNKPPQGYKYCIGVNDGKKVVGVVIVGRPVSRRLDDGWTLEVTRCCTDGTPNACSALYATAWRAAKALGYSKLITYTLKTEPGTSLLAANPKWRIVGQVPAKSWNTPTRLRVDKHELQERLRWELS